MRERAKLLVLLTLGNTDVMTKQSKRKADSFVFLSQLKDSGSSANIIIRELSDRNAVCFGKLRINKQV